MEQVIVTEGIKILPELLWLGFVASILLANRRRIVDELFPNLSGVKAFGFEFTFLKSELDRAVVKHAAQVSEGDRSQVLQRASRHAPVLRGARGLWVDDEPANNAAEQKILRKFGVEIDLARSTDEALTLLHRHSYDVVTTDMEREGMADAFSRLIDLMRQEKVYRWTVIYTLDFDPARGLPPYAFSMTNRPDHVLHSVMDAIEREH